MKSEDDKDIPVEQPARVFGYKGAIEALRNAERSEYTAKPTARSAGVLFYEGLMLLRKARGE